MSVRLRSHLSRPPDRGPEESAGEETGVAGEEARFFEVQEGTILSWRHICPKGKQHLRCLYQR